MTRRPLRILAGAVLALQLIGGGTTPARGQEGDSTQESEPQPPRPQFVVVGTGGVGGTYFPIGGAMCLAVNATAGLEGVRCAVEPTGGSVENLEALRRGVLHFAIVQSDHLAQAVEGNGPFAEGGPMPNLRTLFGLHAQAVTLLARREAGITSIGDLEGRNVNLGPQGSAQRDAVDLLMEAFDWDESDFGLVGELSPQAQSDQLCGGQLDTGFLTLSHPSPLIDQLVRTCGVTLVPVTGEPVSDLLEERPELAQVTIPGGLYPGLDGPVETLGVRAVVVTVAEMPDALVGAVTRAVLADVAEFRDQHPALTGLTLDALESAGDIVPHHPGALAEFVAARAAGPPPGSVSGPGALSPPAGSPGILSPPAVPLR